MRYLTSAFRTRWDTDVDKYPILPGGLYTGGRPGADRVVFDNAGDYCTYVPAFMVFVWLLKFFFLF